MDNFQDKLQLFLKWSKQVGIKYAEDLIQYPVYFEPGHYAGVGVIQDIPANKVIIAVPYTVVLTISKAEQHLKELSKELKKQLKEEDYNNMILSLYLCYEKLKGKDSFFYPYLSFISGIDLFSVWSLEEIKQIQNPYITQAYFRLAKHHEDTIKTMRQVILKYKNLFPESLSDQDISWSIMFVLNRSFGSGFGEVLIPPFIDFSNHTPTAHDMANIYSCKLSCQLTSKPEGSYILKNKCINLELLGVQGQELKKFKPNLKVRMLKQYFPEIDQQQLKQNELAYLTKYLKQELPKNPLQVDIFESNDDEELGHVKQDTNTLRKNFQKIKQRENPPTEFLELQLDYFYRPTLPVAAQIMQGHDFKSWWKYNDQDSYVILSTDRPMKKGEQLLITYGCKTNYHLISSYGFSLMDNRFNSILFSLKKEVGNTIVSEYSGEHIGTEIVGQFEMKQNKLCECLIMYLRYKIIKETKDYSRKVSYPVSFETELQIMTLYEDILLQLRKIYNSSTLESDKIQFEKGNHSSRKTFALISRISQKRLLEVQWSLIKIVKQIIKELLEKRDFKQALNQPRPEWERDELFNNKDGRIFYTRKIIRYLRPLSYLIKK